MKLSVCMLSLNRYDELKRVLEQNLKGLTDYELLICDNGSTDPRIIELIESYKPTYFRKNSRNEGVASALNQLFLRAKGEFVVTMSNDIIMPDNWFEKGLEYHAKVPSTGIVGFDWSGGGLIPGVTDRDGVTAHFLDKVKDRVFGNMLFKREVFDKVGYFCEDYHPYGLEDSDFNERVNSAGYVGFYIPGMHSSHIGTDVGKKTDYRQMKDKSLTDNLPKLWPNLSKYKAGDYYIQPPVLRDPV